MAAKVEKPENASASTENAASPALDNKEVELLRAEIANLRRNYNTLDTNFKRGQKKIAQLESEKDALKTPKDAQPSQTVQPVVASSDTQSVETPENLTREHISDWSPPYCADCGTTNISFKDEVECSNCKVPLGSEKYAKHNMKICPMCGQNAGFKPRKGYTSKHDRCTGPECKVQA